MKNADDSTMVMQAIQGNESAFALLINEYKSTIHALVYHHVGNFHDAEEITQEVFIKAYRNLKTLEEPRKFRNWIYQIARNQAISWLRQENRIQNHISIESENIGVVKASLRQYADDRFHESIKDAINSLPDNERIVVNLHYLGGATSIEIGHILNVPSGTVRYWLHRAKEHLREGFGMVKNELQMKRLSSDFTDKVMDSLGKIEGTVIGMNGKPLGNVKLTLDVIGNDWINCENYIQVNENGHFTMDVPAIIQRYIKQFPDIMEYRIVYSGFTNEGFRHASTPAILLSPGEKYSDCVLDLRKDIHKLRLRILDTKGTPIPDSNASISIVYNGKGGHGFPNIIDTDENGLTPQLLLDSFEYAFSVVAPNKAPINWLKVKAPDGIPENGILNIVMEDGGKISGKVINSRGEPVPNADLQIRYFEASGYKISHGRHFGRIWSDSEELQTNNDGCFTITTLYPTGLYTIQVCHPDYGVDGMVDIPVGSNDIIFKLKPVVSLSGKVMKGKKPVIDARINAVLTETSAEYKVFENARIAPNHQAVTDSSGVFRIPYLFPESVYRLEIYHNGAEYKNNIQTTSQIENHLTIRLD